MNEHEKIVLGFRKLHPTAEFTLSGDTLDGLNIITKGIKKPNQEELDKAITEAFAEKEAKQIKQIADRDNALVKLAALGLTEDEAKAVIGV